MSQSQKVYAAMNLVQEELSRTGIGKDRKNTAQNYAFRGIDDIMNAISPLLARHKLLIVPRVVERETRERETKNGTSLYYTTVKVEYDFISTEDGSKHVACVYGEAMDSGDKSCNKALSAAYKYLCMQTFAIPTEGDNDADQTTHSNIRHPGNSPAQAPKQPPQGQSFDNKVIEQWKAKVKHLDSLIKFKEAMKDYRALPEELKPEAWGIMSSAAKAKGYIYKNELNDFTVIPNTH